MTNTTITNREVRIEPHGYDSLTGYAVELILWEQSNDNPDWKRPSKEGQYALKIITDDMADSVRGDIPETDGTPVMYVGDHFGRHYWTSKNHESKAVDLVDVCERNGLTLVEKVDGGWASWDGRPEWSTTYVDFSEARVASSD